MLKIKNRYVLHSEWHKDIFSTTHVGFDEVKNRHVLVTHFHAKWLSENVIETMTRATQSLMTLRHAALAHLIDTDTDGRTFTLVYDVPESIQPMEKVIRTHRDWRTEDYVRIITRVFDGLLALEQKNLFHGHLHFATIWMHGDTPLLAHAVSYALVFAANLRRLTKYDNAIFLAPEQLMSQSGSSSSDIFSVGVMLYILLSHRWPVPYTATLSELISAYQEGIQRFQPIEAQSPLMENYLKTMLGITPKARFGTISECQQALALVRYSRPTEEPPLQETPPPIPEVAEVTKIKMSYSIDRRILIGIPLVVLIGLVITYMIYTSYMTSVPVQKLPDVTGLPVKEAKQKLEALGLRVSIGGARFSIDIPPGYVLESRPAAGRDVKQSRLIVLYVSKRSEEIQIPDLEGRSWTQALALASEIGLSLVTLDEQYSASIEKNHIISQNITPNSTVSANVTLGVSVSKGFPVSLTISPSASGEAYRTVTVTLSVPAVWPSQTIVIAHQSDSDSKNLFSKTCAPGFATTLTYDLAFGDRLQVVYNNITAGNYDIVDPVVPSEHVSTSDLSSE